MNEALGAFCGVHPTERAAITCHRCGSFACTECLNLHDGVEYCERCWQREFGGKASGRAVLTLVLAIISLNCMWPLGIASVILGSQELAAIARGEAPMKGRSLAKGGLIIGWIGVGLTVVAVGVGIAFVLMA